MRTEVASNKNGGRVASPDGRLDSPEDRLAVAGLLASGLVHDLNNLLGPILTNSELILKLSGADSPIYPLALESAEAATRIGQLCTGLLRYVQRGELDLPVVSVDSVIEKSVSLYRQTVASRAVNFAVSIAEGLPAVRMHEDALIQILLNLYRNALESAPEHPVNVLVTATLQSISQSRLQTSIVDVKVDSEGTAERPFVVICVEDDGSGIPAELMAHIFDPFWTSKPAGHGLGLAVAVGTLRLHQAALFVERRPHKGTRFEIGFPVPVEVADSASTAN